MMTRIKQTIALSFLLLLSACATRKTVFLNNSETGVIQEVIGEVDVSSNSSDWSRAQIGTAVHSGDRIRTGHNATATLNLGSNGGNAQLTPGSLVEIERLGASSQEPDILAILNLLQGRIIGDTKNPPKNGKVLIRTLAGTYEIH